MSLYPVEKDSVDQEVSESKHQAQPTRKSLEELYSRLVSANTAWCFSSHLCTLPNRTWLLLGQTGAFQHGGSGNVDIATGSMRPKRSIEGTPGDINLQAGFAGNKVEHDHGHKYGSGYGHFHTQNQGGGN